MPTAPHVEPPRLGRSVLIQLLALAAGALANELPWSRTKAVPEPPPQPPHKEERRIRVVRIEKPPPPPPPKTAAPAPAPEKAPARSKPAPPKPAPAKPAPKKSDPPAPTRIAADSTAIHGVRMRVLVPRRADELAAHLRNSGGCLVVSRLTGGSAEVVSVLGIDGVRAVERPGPPCNGVPRLLREGALNEALGDPLGRARAANAGEELVLQVLLTDRLHDAAQSALHARFGAVSEQEMGRLAAQSGYELTCFAEPLGSIRCQ
ncbi:MAG: hypothetical protein ABR567_02005 [Myxococcales bacterium]|nr:hypothetical protein [Myxococcales bacterium]